MSNEIVFVKDSYRKSFLSTCNVIVAGITGTGKSTLINAVFGSELAETGRGKPITQNMQEYKCHDAPIRIWDTAGLELDSIKTQQSISDIQSKIAEKAASTDQNDLIHAIWYCINSGSNRYQGAELTFIKNLHSLGVPFIIILTQCIGDEAQINSFEEEINRINRENNMDDIITVQVLAKEYPLRSGNSIEAFGLKELINITVEKMSDYVVGSFIAAQRVDKLIKRSFSHEIINEAINDSLNGFFDNIIVADMWMTNSRIKNMFINIAKIYNTKLNDDELNSIFNEVGDLNWESIIGGFTPFGKAYKERMERIFKERKNEGSLVKTEGLSQSQRGARMIAYFGYAFIDAVEELWDEKFTKANNSLRDEGRMLRDKLNDRLSGSH